MKLSSFNLFSLIISSVSFSIFKILGKNIKLVIPKKINNYNYQRTLNFEKGSDTAVALYKDEKGKKVVAKIWMGRIKNYSYYSIKNEYLFYKLFLNVENRIEYKKPLDLKFIKVPKLIDYLETKNQVTLIIEFIDGKDGTLVDDKKILKSYIKISKYFDFISENVLEEERNLISQRSGYSYFVVYIFSLIISIVKNYDKKIDLINGLKIVIKSLNKLLSNNKLTLVHRDLNFENIIFSNNYVYIVDFQFMVFTYKNQEFAATLRYCWDKNRLKNEIESLIVSEYKLRPEIMNLQKVFNIMHATQGLTANNFTKKTIYSICNFLRASL